MEGEKNIWDNPDVTRALAEFAELAIEEEKLSGESDADEPGIGNVITRKKKLFQELLGYGMSEGEIFDAVDKARDKMEK